MVGRGGHGQGIQDPSVIPKITARVVGWSYKIGPKG